MVCVSLMLASCSSVEDDIYEIFKCSKVAAQLGHPEQGRIAMEKMKMYEDEIDPNMNPGIFMMEMNQRFQDDLELYRYTSASAVRIMSDVYESGFCQDLYE